jgi:hypothetical protein
VRLWKLLGLAGVVGITVTGAALTRRRHWRQYDSDELRQQLHRRLAESQPVDV